MDAQRRPPTAQASLADALILLLRSVKDSDLDEVMQRIERLEADEIERARRHRVELAGLRELAHAMELALEGQRCLPKPQLAQLQEAPEPVPNVTSQIMSEFGRIGGEARSEKLSPERRSEIASEAAKKRWNGRLSAAMPSNPEPAPEQALPEPEPEPQTASLDQVPKKRGRPPLTEEERAYRAHLRKQARGAVTSAERDARIVAAAGQTAAQTASQTAAQEAVKRAEAERDARDAKALEEARANQEPKTKPLTRDIPLAPDLSKTLTGSIYNTLQQRGPMLPIVLANVLDCTVPEIMAATVKAPRAFEALPDGKLSLSKEHLAAGGGKPMTGLMQRIADLVRDRPYTVKEAAEALGTSESSVKMSLGRAGRRLAVEDGQIRLPL